MKKQSVTLYGRKLLLLVNPDVVELVNMHGIERLEEPLEIFERLDLDGISDKKAVYEVTSLDHNYAVSSEPDTIKGWEESLKHTGKLLYDKPIPRIHMKLKGYYIPLG